MKYIPTIGLEIHAELKTKTKMFCDSLNDPDEKRPNINICPICMGHPGTLPVANAEAIKKIIGVGLALDCSINPETFFERKNYFYPDLPKGYQITQFQKPFCHSGKLEIGNPSAGAQGSRRIRIERIHLEEDVGRLQHTSHGDATLVDYNRAGIPLMELVTKPDLRTSQDVVAFAQELRLILRYLGASDADMEKGQMRVEVNISVAPEGAKELGTKVEVKNINSINAAGRAAEYELKRQTEALENGEKIVQETRGWDENKGITVSQRTKEGSADYRYFPEPDLPPVVLVKEEINGIESVLPELPSKRRERFAKEYSLPVADVEVFTTNKSLGDDFEKAVSEAFAARAPENDADKIKTIKLLANYLINVYKPGPKVVTPEMFGQFARIVVSGTVSSSVAGVVLKEMAQTGLNPDHIIHEKDLGQVSDEDELNRIISQVIMDNPAAVTDLKKGKEASLKFLIGKTMAASKGKANPQMVERLIKEKIL
ncbi:MAG: Asp-tRNA(Asn)/Glu-tRNA(Gln) amidotransferase subunit GatB [Patescibacteria group bacterium]|mgnify:CR=1 FL=1